MNKPKISDFDDMHLYDIALEQYAAYAEHEIYKLKLKLHEAYVDGFNDNRKDFDIENYID